MLPTRNSKYNNIDKLKAGGQKNMYYANNQRLSYQSRLWSQEKLPETERDVMVKWTIHHEDIEILSVYS